MKRVFVVLSSVAQRVNPIVVKEFRQAVRSRLVVAILLLFLLVNLFVLGGFVLLSPNAGASNTVGRETFMTLWGVLMFTCIGFVPLYAGVRLSMERNDANVDLLFITTITPGAIVRGKFFSALALTVLIFSACTPFLTLTYLLRGIDLPTIFFLLMISLCICAGVNMLGILAGSVPGSGLLRALGGVGLLVALIYSFAGTMALGSSRLFFGMGLWSFWNETGPILLLELAAIGLAYVLAVAILSPRLSNRMLVPRLYMMATWAITAVIMGLLSYFNKSLNPMEAWVIFSTAVLVAALFAAMGERDAWSSRVRKSIPQNRLLRLPAFLLYSGAAGGVVWCVLMFAATLAVATAWYWYPPILRTTLHSTAAGLERNTLNAAVCFGYALCYCLTAAFLRIAILRRAPTPVLPWVAALFGLIGCMLLPFLVASLTSPRSWDPDPWWKIASPFALDSFRAPDRAEVVRFLVAWIVLSLVLSGRWFVGQWQRFVPYRVEEPLPPVQATLVEPAMVVEAEPS